MSSEQPRERLQSLGPQALTTAELIAIILGTGTTDKPVRTLAHELLSKYSLRALSTATLHELTNIHGLGEAKALKLQAALALATRLDPELLHQPLVTPEDFHRALLPHLQNSPQEKMALLLLDGRMRMIRTEVASLGSLTETMAHPREIFRPAIRHGAACLVIGHSHPSGDPTPSEADKKLTALLTEAGQLLGIPLIDHLVVANENYISLIGKSS